MKRINDYFSADCPKCEGYGTISVRYSYLPQGFTPAEEEIISKPCMECGYELSPAEERQVVEQEIDDPYREEDW